MLTEGVRTPITCSTIANSSLRAQDLVMTVTIYSVEFPPIKAESKDVINSEDEDSLDHKG